MCHFDIDPIKNRLLKIHINNNKCLICMSSKLKNKPYKPSINKTKHIFELIHIDLVGAVSESLYGNKYFITISDWYYSLKIKATHLMSFSIGLSKSKINSFLQESN